jgi:hypothetical protein
MLEVTDPRTLLLKSCGGERMLPIYPSTPRNTLSTRRINMKRFRKTIIAGVLMLCSATLSYGGTITGSRTGASSSRVGTITGSRAGTITGSRTGTITGSRLGTITGSAVGSSTGTFEDNIYNELLFRLMTIVMNGVL